MAPALVQNGHANGSAAKLAATAKVFQAIQGHWLSACLGVLMELRIPEILADKRQMTFTEAYPKTTLHLPSCCAGTTHAALAIDLLQHNAPGLATLARRIYLKVHACRRSSPRRLA